MTSFRVVDHDRQRVYDAEDAAFGGTTLDDRLSWDEVEALVAAVTADAWWSALGVAIPRVLPTRVDARTSCATGREIRISPVGRTAATISHELSHHLCGHLRWARPADEGPHGPRFRATALRVAVLVGGDDARAQLAGSWQIGRLSVAEWEWAEPASRGPRALREVTPLPPASN